MKKLLFQLCAPLVQLNLVLLVGFAAGCGGPAVGKVTGKISANGQPVTEGIVTFAPLATSAPNPGSPSIGQVKLDGTFELGMKKAGDGAVVGRHQVLYAPPGPEGPEWDGYGTPPVMKVSPFANFVPKELEMEIKPGKNEVSIELVPGPPPVTDDGMN